MPDGFQCYLNIYQHFPTCNLSDTNYIVKFWYQCIIAGCQLSDTASLDKSMSHYREQTYKCVAYQMGIKKFPFASNQRASKKDLRGKVI